MQSLLLTSVQEAVEPKPGRRQPQAMLVPEQICRTEAAIEGGHGSWVSPCSRGILSSQDEPCATEQQASRPLHRAATAAGTPPPLHSVSCAGPALSDVTDSSFLAQEQRLISESCTVLLGNASLHIHVPADAAHCSHTTKDVPGVLLRRAVAGYWCCTHCVSLPQAASRVAEKGFLSNSRYD